MYKSKVCVCVCVCVCVFGLKVILLKSIISCIFFYYIGKCGTICNDPYCLHFFLSLSLKLNFRAFSDCT